MGVTMKLPPLQYWFKRSAMSVPVGTTLAVGIGLAANNSMLPTSYYIFLCIFVAFVLGVFLYINAEKEQVQHLRFCYFHFNRQSTEKIESPAEFFVTSNYVISGLSYYISPLEVGGDESNPAYHAYRHGFKVAEEATSGTYSADISLPFLIAGSPIPYGNFMIEFTDVNAGRSWVQEIVIYPTSDGPYQDIKVYFRKDNTREVGEIIYENTRHI